MPTKTNHVGNEDHTDVHESLELHGLGPCNFYKLIIAKTYYFAWRHVEDMNNDNVLIFKIGHSRLYRVSPQKAERSIFVTFIFENMAYFYFIR